MQNVNAQIESAIDALQDTLNDAYEEGYRVELTLDEYDASSADGTRVVPSLSYKIDAPE